MTSSTITQLPIPIPLPVPAALNGIIRTKQSALFSCPSVRHDRANGIQARKAPGLDRFLNMEQSEAIV